MLNKLKTNKLTQLIFAITLFTIASFVFGTHKAEAATINVNSGCTINDAIDSVNSATDSGSCNSTGVYGTNDIINIPAGTQLLTGDLTGISASSDLTINGVGKDQTIIDANGFVGFSAINSRSYTFNNFTIKNALTGIYADVVGVTMNNIDVNHSGQGVSIMAEYIAVTNSAIHDNIQNDGDSAGLILTPTAFNPGDDITTSVQNTQIYNNAVVGGSDRDTGLIIGCQSSSPNSNTINIENTTISGNMGHTRSGFILDCNKPTPLDLTVNAVTISENNVTVDVARTVTHAFDAQPYLSGVYIATGVLVDKMHFTNVTTTGNIVVNNLDNRISLAGFEGIVFNSPHLFNLTNNTVVNNSSIQATPNTDVPFTPTFVLVNFTGSGISGSGGSARNSLLAHNTFNGNNHSCINNLDATLFGGSGTVDLTPTNLTGNLTDDSNCTGYTNDNNLYNTLGSLQDNGGPVPTIALLPGSPAIAAGGAVLGISTDARGIARPSTPDVGAYQTVLSANTSSPNNGLTGVAIPNSGFGGLANNPQDKDDSITPLLLIINLVSFVFGFLTIRKIKQYAE